MSNIAILSQPIRSGKTTKLMEIADHRIDLGGFLTPDIDGLRKVYLLGNRAYIDFETLEDDGVVNVGRFKFLASTFELCRKHLIQDTKPYLIVDELGKLELDQKGFEPELSQLIHAAKQPVYKQKLLLVIRDSLLETAIERYDLGNAEIYSTANITQFFK